MPIFMDRHEMAEVTAEAVAEAHMEDLKLQERYGCRAITYWFDEVRGTAFCLFEAPSPTVVREIHRAAHGQVPNEIIEVKPSEVTAYLGRALDPDLPSGEPLREPAFRVLMFTDIANSTSMTDALGDKAAFDLIRQHDEVVRNALKANSGREVDRAGDGFLASFFSVESAVTCAIEIQGMLQKRNTAAVTPIQVRIGLGAGEPVTDGNTIFGSVVNQTARICAYAQPGQILVSSVVQELCVGKKIRFSDIGPVSLKGFPSPVHLYEVSKS